VLHLALNLTLFVAAVFWLGVACWVYRDARRRSRDLWMIGASTLLGLVPVVGPVGYLLIRPPETRDEAKTRRVEVEALESWLRREPPHCPTCLAGVEASFLVCPVCTTRLKEPCAGCSAPLAPTWLVCPFCTLDVKAPRAYDLDAALTAEAALQGVGGARPNAKRVRRAQQAQAS
jgi:Double zinc ribbon